MEHPHVTAEHDVQAAARVRLLEALNQLQRRIEAGALTRLQPFSMNNPSLGLNPSVRNLLHYLEFRSLDQRLLQRMLTEQGLSSLGRCEAHVSDAIQRVTRMVQLALQVDPEPFRPDDAITLEQGQDMLTRNTDRLLGPASPKRRVRIMVTLPTEAATDYSLVKSLMAGGMDVARINCAHDDPAAWHAMAAHVRRAASELGRGCRIAADLAGHKIRTGALAPVNGVLHLKPRRDRYGRVLSPARVVLFAQHPPSPEYAHGLGLGIAPATMAALAPGDTLVFEDARGARRHLLIESTQPSHAWATLAESALVRVVPSPWKHGVAAVVGKRDPQASDTAHPGTHVAFINWMAVQTGKAGAEQVQPVADRCRQRNDGTRPEWLPVELSALTIGVLHGRVGRLFLEMRPGEAGPDVRVVVLSAVVE